MYFPHMTFGLCLCLLLLLNWQNSFEKETRFHFPHRVENVDKGANEIGRQMVSAAAAAAATDRQRQLPPPFLASSVLGKIICFERNDRRSQGPWMEQGA